ncbi:MAG: ABC-2 transporter permease [Oscillospiraceae bacterium]
MKALILKDFYTIGNFKKMYIILFAAAAAAVIFVPSFTSFIPAFLILYSCSSVMSVFSYDDFCNWNRFAACLPVKRSGIVLARYLFSALYLLAVALVCFLISFAGCFFHGLLGEIPSIGLSTLILAGISIWVLSACYPIIYFLGYQKGRVAMVVLLAALFSIVITVAKVAKIQLASISLSQVVVAIVIFLLLAFAAFAGSFFFSRRIYEAKDF